MAELYFGSKILSTKLWQQLSAGRARSPLRAVVVSQNAFVAASGGQGTARPTAIWINTGIIVLPSLAIRAECRPRKCLGAWLSPVERLVWDQDVAGSNPVAPTIFLPESFLQPLIGANPR
jgi:hypothetical protein